MRNDELRKEIEAVKEVFIARVRGMFGEIDEFEQWADALDLASARTGNDEAWDYADAALTQLIRTTDPSYEPKLTRAPAPLQCETRC